MFKRTVILLLYNLLINRPFLPFIMNGKGFYEGKYTKIEYMLLKYNDFI